MSFSVDRVFNLPQVMELKRRSLSADEMAFLEKSFEKTLEEVLRMRKREGMEIASEIRSSLQRIGQKENYCRSKRNGLIARLTLGSPKE